MPDYGAATPRLAIFVPKGATPLDVADIVESRRPLKSSGATEEDQEAASRRPARLTGISSYLRWKIGMSSNFESIYQYLIVNF